MVNAAWNALFEKDLEDVSFKALAKEIGVTPQAIYHYYPSLTSRFDPLVFPSVAGERMRLGRAVCDLLEAELGTEPENADLHIFWGIIHGSACLIASGATPQPRHLLLACQRQLELLRTTPRSGPG